MGFSDTSLCKICPNDHPGKVSSIVRVTLIGSELLFFDSIDVKLAQCTKMKINVKYSLLVLKAICFVNSFCMIFSLWKQDPPHQTFSGRSWHQSSYYENKILVWFNMDKSQKFNIKIQYCSTSNRVILITYMIAVLFLRLCMVIRMPTFAPRSTMSNSIPGPSWLPTESTNTCPIKKISIL